ncbi:MAG: DUF2892 domain-containing protein [Sphingobacteriaceae bacterium]|nr:DUF2892 domain-containing protein [Sphingobacteriaceae bacterium]
MENSIINKVSDTLNNSILQESAYANVGQTERIISVGAGAFIALKGITNVFSHPFLAITELGLGTALLYRGLTGYCPVKEKMDEQEMNSYQDSSFSDSGSPTVPVTAMPTETY